jgi:hypothetical protein
MIGAARRSGSDAAVAVLLSQQEGKPPRCFQLLPACFLALVQAFGEINRCTYIPEQPQTRAIHQVGKLKNVSQSLTRLSLVNQFHVENIQQIPQFP